TAADAREDASLDAYEDDNAGEWFTIRKGKAIKTLPRPTPPSVPAPTSSLSEETDTATSPSTNVAVEESIAEVSGPESQSAATDTWSQGGDGDWFDSCDDEEQPAVPSKPQAIPSQHYCIPAKNPNWLEERAERNRKAMEAWNALQEARREAERARVEEEERKAREVQEAKAARLAKFDTTMGRLNELRKASEEERQKQEQKKEENERTIKGIGLAQNRIGEMIDMEKVRAMFDPEVLKTSSFSAVVGQERVI
ncbi:hypothetical protein C0993_001998, partial [Termitomyces sp. T159_Od127]